MAGLAEYQALFTWMAVVSAFTFFISLLTLPWLVARIPVDYFCHEKRHPTPLKQTHPILRIVSLVGKNLLGWVLLLGGLIMLFIPGQGLLTIAMGLLLMDYPGKFSLERKIVRKPKILNSLNWLRRKVNTPPLEIDAENAD
jgi:archaellum biogenesis protein FlaJ (TadC family)